MPCWRLMIEGDVARDVRRRFGQNVAVEALSD
jgi:hypothetical protein